MRGLLSGARTVCSIPPGKSQCVVGGVIFAAWWSSITSESLGDVTCDSLGDVTRTLSTHDVKRSIGKVQRIWMRKQHQEGQNRIVMSTGFFLLRSKPHSHVYEGFFTTVVSNKHLGSLTAANWVSIDFNVAYSPC